MLLTTACSSEDVAPVAEQESLVSFTVELPADAQARSRAEYGDGLTALNLQWQVYDESGAKMNVQGNTTFTNRVATVTMRLANSRKYNILFWASATGSPYSFNPDTKEVAVNYTGVTAQDERHDAFFAHYEMSAAVSGSISETVYLYRPFAQVNIGATDATQAKNAGWETETTQVTISKAYKTLNLYNGEVTNPTEVVYAYAAKPAATETFPASVTADYQSMVYVLTEPTSNLVDVKFEAKDNGDVITRTYTNVPVQRNYRTNIYGNILTEEANFTIEIKPGFQTPANDYAVPEPGTAMVNGVQYATLQAAVNAAAASGTEVNVTVGAGSYTLPMPSTATGVSLSVSGQGDASEIVVNGTYGTSSPGRVTSVAISNAKLTLPQADSNSIYNGFGHATVELNGVTVNNMIATYGTFKATDCTFNGTLSYAVHVYGSGTVEFNKCAFTSQTGKGVFAYGEHSEENNMIFTDCTFTSTTVRADKAPVQMHTELGTHGTLTMTNCSATGFGDPRGNGLWNELNNGTGVATTKFTITIGGAVVQTAH